MRLLTILIAVLFSTTLLFAQEELANNEKKIINSFDAEIQYGQGGGIIGIMGKGNHWWFEKKQFKVQSGLLVNLFYVSEGYEKNSTKISGSTFDSHIQFHTGIEQSFFAKDKIYLLLEMYGGFYGIFTNGNYENSEFGIERSYKNSDFLWDYGSRFGFGYRVKEKWGIQLSLTNSWRQVNRGIGFLPGFIAGQPDAKYSLGIGINYRLK